MKRTLKRELKVLEIVKRETVEVSIHSMWDSARAASGACRGQMSFGASTKVREASRASAFSMRVGQCEFGLG